MIGSGRRGGVEEVSVPDVASITALPLQIMLVLLFPARAPQDPAVSGDPPDGFEPIPTDAARARMDQLHEIEVALLGIEYLMSRRITRLPVGRVRLPVPQGVPGPDHADVFLVTHTTGVALWEAWIPVPDQPLDAARFVEWLRSDVAASPAALLRERIAALRHTDSETSDIEEGFPFTILRRPAGEPSIDAIATSQAGELVRLLYLDRSSLAFKSGVIAEELARDFCLREGGISLIAARSAIFTPGKV
jgi:hypothetical protein